MFFSPSGQTAIDGGWGRAVSEGCPGQSPAARSRTREWAMKWPDYFSGAAGSFGLLVLWIAWSGHDVGLDRVIQLGAGFGVSSVVLMMAEGAFLRWWYSR